MLDVELEDAQSYDSGISLNHQKVAHLKHENIDIDADVNMDITDSLESQDNNNHKSTNLDIIVDNEDIPEDSTHPNDLKTIDNNEHNEIAETEQNITIDNNISNSTPTNSTTINNNNTTANFNSLSVIGIDPLISSPRKNTQKLLNPPVNHLPRLVISKLILTNFKSYAGTQEIGPFHPSFSAVVGPNGSGKSNVIDSMLFVFGFRASKMRQSKLKELIHHSENFPNLQFCQVDIYFNKVIDDYDSDGKLVTNIIDNSKLIISRKATKNNVSTYYINDKPSNYTEVTTLLKKEGIDLDHKRFLILQGEVEMIAQMKPKAENEHDDGLLEYLEDIIGTSKYKEQLESISKEIENLNDIYIEKDKKFQYATSQFENIDKQKDLAIDFLKLEKQLVDETKKYWYLMKLSHELSFKKQNEKLNSLNEEFEDIEKNIETSKKNLKNLRKNKNDLNSKLSNFENKLNAEKKQLRIFEKDQISLNEKIKNQDKKRESLKKSLLSDEKSLKTSENELISLTESLKNYDNDVITLNSDLNVENEKLDQIKSELSSKTKKYSTEIEKLQEQLEPWTNKLDEKQSQINITNSEIEILKNQLDSINNQNNELKQSIETKKEKIKINKSTIEDLNKEKANAQSILDSYSDKFNDAGKSLNSLEHKLNELRNKIDYAKTSATNFETQNKVLNALNRLQQTGRITGFYGKLGDLGVIDDKYDIAISTGGGALSDYVVETVEDAQNCIQYLRQNNLGFAKFIVLEKLRKFNLNKINTPSNIPRLFDLINPVDKKFLPAFYSSMYDTLVAPNLSIANKVAFQGTKRWRVVTLDGKLVDASGTMSGGGSRPNSGAMKLSSNSSSVSNNNIISQQELESLKRDYMIKEEEYRNSESVYQKIEQTLRNSQENIPKWSNDILKYEMDNSSLIEDIKECEHRLMLINSKKNETNNLEIEINKQIKTLGVFNSEKNKIEEGSQGLSEKISELQQKILDIGGLKLKTQTSKVKSLKDSIQIKNEMKARDEMKITKLNNYSIKLNKSIETNKKELDDFENITESLAKNFKEVTNKVNELTVIIQSSMSEKAEISDKIMEIDEKIEAEETKITEQSETIGESLKHLNKLKANISKIHDEIDYATNSLKGIECRDVTDYISWISEDDPLRNELIQNNDSIDLQYNEKEIEALDLRIMGDRVDAIKDQLSNLVVNLDILITYGNKKVSYEEQKESLDNTLQELNEVKEKSEELNKRRKDEFAIGHKEISSTLKDMYSLITAGGTAELDCADTNDFSEGIVFSVMPPKKSWRTISNLSGGEKTLASLALVFALHQYKPTPLYVMDEIDAALDFKNVSIVANYIKSRTKNAQFIVISLRNNMFELAERLVGIYKTCNMTKSVTLVNKDLISTASE